MILRFLIAVLCLSAASIIQAQGSLKLSLEEAILLAVRNNPHVKQAQLNYVLQKYALDLAHWQFSPHYSLSAQQTTTRYYSVTEKGYVSENTTGLSPAISWQSPIGTQITLSSDQVKTDRYRPAVSLEIVQPLLRGFGQAVVAAELENAIDSEKIARLLVEEALRNTITAVIFAYSDVMLYQKTLVVDQQTLQRALQSIQQTRYFIHAGHKAGVELVTVQAYAAVARANIEEDLQALQVARYNLLNTIGIAPTETITVANVSVSKLVKKYCVPALALAKKKSLAADVQYQIDQMTLNGAIKRRLLQAKDESRWQLNLIASASKGSNHTNGNQDAGLNYLVNGVNQTNSVALNLTVPLDDHALKNAVSAAKIALREAEIALQQEKWNEETHIINGWNAIASAKRAVFLAEQAERLQKKSWEINYKKYTYGLIDSLQLQSAQEQLVASQQAVNHSQIHYLRTLVSFDQMLGDTLQTWDVQIHEDRE